MRPGGPPKKKRILVPQPDTLTEKSESQCTPSEHEPETRLRSYSHCLPTSQIHYGIQDFIPVRSPPETDPLASYEPLHQYEY